VNLALDTVASYGGIITNDVKEPSTKDVIKTLQKTMPDAVKPYMGKVKISKKTGDVKKVISPPVAGKQAVVNIKKGTAKVVTTEKMAAKKAKRQAKKKYYRNNPVARQQARANKGK